MIYLSGMYTKEWYLAKDVEKDQFGDGESTSANGQAERYPN